MTEYYPPFGAGGAERTAALHAEILVRAGHSVTVVTPNYGAPERETVNGVEVVRFPFPVKLPGPGKQVSSESQTSLTYHRGLARAILRSLEGRRMTCVHAQNSRSLIGAYLAAKRRALPLVSHVRDTAGICSLGAICLLEADVNFPPASCSVRKHLQCHFGRVLPLWAPNATRLGRTLSVIRMLMDYPDFLWRRKVYSKSDRIVFASQGLMKTYAHVRHFKSQERQRVVYAPIIDTGRQEEGNWQNDVPAPVREVKARGGVVVLYVGKVSPGKGAPVLFESHRRLVADIPNVYLAVAGNVQQDLWEFSREKTIFLGFIDRRELEALYRASDLVVVPSTWPEPLGWATIEAGLYGKPVVATRVGGIPEAVEHGVTGFLVDKLDAGGMKEAMENLIRNDTLRHEIGERARVKVLKTFGEEAVRNQLEDLYRGLTQQIFA